MKKELSKGKNITNGHSQALLLAEDKLVQLSGSSWAIFIKTLKILIMSWNLLWASLVTRVVKNTPATLETCVRSLTWEDPLEKEMATHSSI